MPVLNVIDRRLVSRLPEFSPVALRLLTLLASDSLSMKDVSALISLDPVLAGKVLQLANSGLYGRRVQVSSLLHAISMLGSGKLSQIATTAALWRGIPSRHSLFVRDWWRHSIASALIARQRSEDGSSDFAYTAALLHGVGQLALFEDAPKDYPALVEQAYSDGVPLRERERETFQTDHESLGGKILEYWGLPPELCEAVAGHHDVSVTEGFAPAVQAGCLGAEYAGFGRCGCVEASTPEVSVPLSKQFSNDYLNLLIAGVNGIECSLL